MKVFFAFLYLVLSIQAVVTASADVDHDKESSVTLPGVKLVASLNGPVVLASQASAVSANLRKKQEYEVELEGMYIVLYQIDTMIYVMFVYGIFSRFLCRCDTIRCRRSLSGAVDL